MNTKLTGIPATLLIPLWARSEEGSKQSPIIRDDKAVEMVSEIDYDFSKFKSARLSQVGVAVRTMLFDNAVKNFMKANHEAIVINLGVGLDTRHERLGLENVDWYELDVPESIELRRQFFTESEHYHFIAKSMLDTSWMDEIKDSGKPILIISEGLFMYFPEEELKLLFGKMAQRFPDAKIVFDLICPLMARSKGKGHDSLKKVDSSVEFKWGLKDTTKMEKWYPGIQCIDEWSVYDYHKDRWGMFGRIARLPFLRSLVAYRIVHLRFAKATSHGSPS